MWFKTNTHRARPSVSDGRRCMRFLRRTGLLVVPLAVLTSACPGRSSQLTGPTLAALYMLPGPVVLDASPFGRIVLVSSKITLNADRTWSGRDSVTNSEAGSGAIQELVGSGTYSVSDSTLRLQAMDGTVTSFEILNGAAALRRLSTFGRILLYNRLGSTTPL